MISDYIESKDKQKNQSKNKGMGSQQQTDDQLTGEYTIEENQLPSETQTGELQNCCFPSQDEEEKRQIGLEIEFIDQTPQKLSLSDFSEFQLEEKMRKFEESKEVVQPPKE